MAKDTNPVNDALDKTDPLALAQSASTGELHRLKLAEEVLALAHGRKKNTSRLAVLSQVMVGAVAVAGMLVNAYQNFNNKKQQQHQAQIDQDRWSKEFVRAQRADKYRAFFETSVLATDPANPDKRMVGYALLQEFVADDDYNSKATRLLEEALVQELRTNTKDGLDDEHRNAVVAIVTALSASEDCKAMEQAARSIDKIAARHAKAQDVEETSSIFHIYVRRLAGRAALVCKTMRDFSLVRRPLIETVLRLPEIIDVKGKLTRSQANEHIAQMLIDDCRDEVGVTGVTECPSIMQHYQTLCAQTSKDKAQDDRKDDEAACALIKNEGPEIVKLAAGAAAATPSRPDAGDDH